jgi:hypothetical protein
VTTYTALSVIVNVDYDGDGASVTTDGELFSRGPMGEITATSTNVLHFDVTTVLQVLPLQFRDGEP